MDTATMVLEQFIAHVHPGREAEFEAVMERALRTVMSRAEGLLGWRFRRCVETPGRYQVQIHWDSLESHMVKYRQGPIGPEFRALVMPFFVEPPQMQHFENLAQG